MSDEYIWWRDGIIYQIYPRSFMDANNDGVGDLKGIITHLDYLADLGVDAIWLSPVYPSPDKDFGYDVSNYVDIDPRFGNMADFDELISAAHHRQIRVMMDLVLNHTSNQHPWFQQSRRSQDNPYRDWYLWRPCRGGSKPPNNWQSVFGGKGWEYDLKTGEYYFHMFLREQPDLNWRNPEVRAAMLNVFRFWLDRGVDGFRLDVFNGYFKDAALRDNPGRFGLRGFDRQQHIYDADQPELLPLLGEIRTMLDSHGSNYAVGETFLSSPEKALKYSAPGKLHAAFNFKVTQQHWQAARFARCIWEWEELNQPDGWPSYVLNNHDIPRSTTRYHFDLADRMSKVAAAMLLTLRGTPFMYYGEEIGMRDVRLSRTEIMDPPGKKYWPLYKGRDGCRAPMQWNDHPQAGFSTVKPWLKVHPEYRKRNVQQQLADLDSLLNFYRAAIRLRRNTPALTRGTFRLLEGMPSSVLAYIREQNSQKVLVILNFGTGRAVTPMPEWVNPRSVKLLLNSRAENELAISQNERITLAPAQALILDVSQA